MQALKAQGGKHGSGSPPCVPRWKCGYCALQAWQVKIVLSPTLSLADFTQGQL